MRYSPYPDYSEEAADCLGAVPSHWKRMPLKRKFRIVNGSTPSSDPEYWDGDIVWITPADFRNTEAGYLSTSERRITRGGLNSCGTSLVPPNSIVITTRAPIGGVAQAKVEFCSNQGCKSLALDAADVHERFVFYVLHSSSPQLNALGLGSTFMELSTENLGMYGLPLPTVPEQQQVAAFLDWKTGQIDALIARKRELLEKLKEKRVAVINQAVTRGLNPDAPLRDSGTTWLGQVPQHWTLNYKLGFISASERNSFVNGPFGSDLLTSELVDEGVPVLYSGDVKATRFVRKSGKYVTEEKAQELDFCRADAGDLLLAKVGAPPGDACIYPIDSPAAVVLVSAMGRHLVRLVSVEATRGRFSLADVKNIRFPLPPLAEQKAIAERVAKALKRMDDMNEVNETAIARLAEYRTALITAATRGTIDVRNVEIPNPVA
jgi:type I restriction enzyme, S subunit